MEVFAPVQNVAIVDSGINPTTPYTVQGNNSIGLSNSLNNSLKVRFEVVMTTVCKIGQTVLVQILPGLTFPQ